ncbi:transporter substrate-binding domain-containing protein [Flammeovirgaceae bacterium SG7u.111]|nr:transporter substrate-binding domain-containing protein [Flammeovirgaceae bacterium SG7u.132]WPO36217.1 transporter substrate-binding domain-containing protein [Flammeovirgaceae bacterium SG7u.111]
MKNIVKLFLVIATIILVGGGDVFSQNTPLFSGLKSLEFTEEENAWLAAHPVIKFGYTPDYLPIEYMEDGVYKGLAADYLQIISEKTGVKFEPVPELTWSTSVELFKKGEVDILPELIITEERSQLMIFTKPYIHFPMVIITRNDFGFVSEIKDLKDYIIAVPRDYYIKEYLENDFPEIELIIADNPEAALKKVSVNEADAYIGQLAVADYVIKKSGYSNLKVAAPTQYDNFEAAMGIRKDWVVFRGIVQKVLDSISEESSQAIKKRWLDVELDFEKKEREFRQRMRLLSLITLGVLVVATFWTISLKRQIKKRRKAEQGLKVQKEFIQRVIDNDPNLVFVKNREGRFILVNKATATAYNTSVEDLLNKTLAESHVHEQEVAEYTSDDIKVIDTGLPIVKEETFTRDDKGVKWLLINKVPIKNEAGEVCSLGIASDITELKQAEIAIRDSEERFKALADSTNEGVIIHSLGKVLGVNDVFCSMFKLQPDKLEQLQEEDLIQDGLEEGVAKFKAKKMSFKSIDLMCKRSDGTIFPAEVSSKFIEYKQQTTQVTTFRDLTERKKIEDDLKETNEELRASEEELRQQSEELLTVNEMLEAQKVELEQTIAQLKTAQAKLINAEKMASLGVLTAGIAHEINNPVNFVQSGIRGVRNNLEDLLEIIGKYNEITPENASQGLEEVAALKEELEFDFIVEDLQQGIKDISTGAERTSEIVKGLRTFSRSDETALKFIDIHENIDSTLVLLRKQYKNKVAIEKEYGDLPRIEAFPGKLNQVFMNILSNAIQAVNEHGKIVISTEILEGNTIQIKFADNGKGMSEEIKRKMFDPFFTTKEVGVGVGLGLSICLGIIKDHDGSIEVESEEGKGTLFIISLPIEHKSSES